MLITGRKHVVGVGSSPRPPDIEALAVEPWNVIFGSGFFITLP